MSEEVCNPPFITSETLHSVSSGQTTFAKLIDPEMLIVSGMNLGEEILEDFPGKLDIELTGIGVTVCKVNPNEQ
jgi:hypothetical protein